MPRPKKIVAVKCKPKHLQGVRWVVDLGRLRQPNGKVKRVRKHFTSPGEAERFAKEERDKLREHGVSALELTHAERIVFQDSRDRLAAAGATITQATDFYLQHHRALRERITLGTLFERAALAKELQGLRSHSLSQFACSCRSFIRGREMMMADEATKDEVKKWILSQGFAPGTQRTYLGDVRAMFEWGLEERYLHVNPIAGKDGFIKLTAEEEEEISSFGPEHAEALLRTALFGVAIERERAGTGRWRPQEVPGGFRHLIGYIASAMFVGVRPEENKRVGPERVDTRERTLVVVGKAAKRVNSKGPLRRPIELDRTAAIWLRLWQRLCPGARLVPPNFQKKWRELRAAAGLLAGWPHDVLRHTAATMHFALHRNRAHLQAMLGHSEDEDTLEKRYRAVMTISGRTVSRRLAEEFYALTPRKVRLKWRAKHSPLPLPPK